MRWMGKTLAVWGVALAFGCEDEAARLGTEYGGGGEGEGDGGDPALGPCGDDCSRELVRIPAGEFMMGSPEDELGRDRDEVLHRVRIDRPFLIRRTEVTQAEWTEVMGETPSHFADCGGRCPVEQISWLDAVELCNALSRRAGQEECYVVSGDSVTWPNGLDCPGYRLPTEAEWEYAARAGTSTSLHEGDLGAERCNADPGLDRAGWYCGNSDDTSHPVAQKEPNAWGLYDVHGNVFELAWDWYGAYVGDATDPTGPPLGEYRVTRGGSWFSAAQHCRSPSRAKDELERPVHHVGVRPVRSALP